MVLPVTMGMVVDSIPLAPPRVSLVTSVDVATGDGDWLSGIAFGPEPCGPPPQPYWWSCPQGDGGTPQQVFGALENGIDTKQVPAPESIVHYQPYDVWLGIRCGNMAIRSGEYQTKARQAMDAFQSALIETELWTGAIAQAAGFPNDYLENSPTELNSGTAAPIISALGEMEQGLAECQPGQIGVIHAQPRVVNAWIAYNLVQAEASGRRLRTQLGTIVVPGGGYPGTGNGVASPGVASSYIYGTGMVRVYLGDIATIPEGGIEVDRATNDQVIRVERTVAAVWDECCQLAIEVDLSKAL